MTITIKIVLFAYDCISKNFVLWKLQYEGQKYKVFKARGYFLYLAFSLVA